MGCLCGQRQRLRHIERFHRPPPFSTISNDKKGGPGHRALPEQGDCRGASGQDRSGKRGRERKHVPSTITNKRKRIGCWVEGVGGRKRGCKDEKL